MTRGKRNFSCLKTNKANTRRQQVLSITVTTPPPPSRACQVTHWAKNSLNMLRRGSAGMSQASIFAVDVGVCSGRSHIRAHTTPSTLRARIQTPRGRPSRAGGQAEGLAPNFPHVEVHLLCEPLLFLFVLSFFRAHSQLAWAPPSLAIKISEPQIHPSTTDRVGILPIVINCLCRLIFYDLFSFFNHFFLFP